MRILLFLEPAIFHDDPSFISAHLIWAACFEQAALAQGGSFALATNETVCDRWRGSPGPDSNERVCFPIDSFDLLVPFGYRRADYAKALYGPGDAPNPLTARLRAIRAEHAPDLVVMSSQNAFARHAFAGLPILSIEQAPLPRLGHEFRTLLDPMGHQTGSLLETHAAEIRALPLTAGDHYHMLALMLAIEQHMLSADPRSVPACAALSALRGGARVALFATQPPDWVTYEGADRDVDLAGLILSWAERLPEGWVAVPTYHPGYRLSADMEAALARASPRLRFLPEALSQGMTEPLLSVADGLVAVSSTSAMTALLLQKKVVVTGRSPYNAWCPGRPEAIDEALPLSRSEVTATLAFLTHRYAHLHSRLMAQPELLAEILEAIVRSSDPASWFLDLSTWTVERARSLFNLGEGAASLPGLDRVVGWADAERLDRGAEAQDRGVVTA